MKVSIKIDFFPLLSCRLQFDGRCLDRVIYLCYVVRNGNARASAKRQSARHKKTDDKQSEKRKKRISQQRRKAALDRCDDETANLNRVLVERMLLKNSGFNQGSRSVGGTPMCLRRRKHDVNKNLSPMRLNDNSSAIRPSMIENEIVKRRSNSVGSKFNSYIQCPILIDHTSKFFIFNCKMFQTKVV